MSGNKTFVDLFNFRESSTGANVDIVTIEHGNENDLGSINRSFGHLTRASSPYRDRVADRYNRSLSPTGSPRLKRSTPRSVSPGVLLNRVTSPIKSLSPSRLSPTKLSRSSPTKHSPSKISPLKNTLNSTLDSNINTIKNEDEIRRLRFENLILQSKVESLETENKSLKEQLQAVPHTTPTATSRDLYKIKQELENATKEVEKLKRENDDLTSQIYSLRVDRLENPNTLTRLARENPQEWTGCQADAIEHLCSENQRLRETLFDINEQKLHTHRLMENNSNIEASTVRQRLNSVQLDNQQLTEEKNRLLSKLDKEKEDTKKLTEQYEKLREDYSKVLAQTNALRDQLSNNQMENNTIKNLTERCAELQSRLDKREKDLTKELDGKERELQGQIEDHENKLQRGISRSAIQIGLLNEEMRVALNALIAVNKEFDNEDLEEHLDALNDISKNLENLEGALDKTLGSEYALDMPLRGTSGEKISQLLEELEFYKALKGDEKKRKPGKGMDNDSELAFKRLKHQLECSYQEKLHMSSQLSLLEEQCNMYKETLAEKDRQLIESEDVIAKLQEQFAPHSGPNKIRHRPMYPPTMSPENMRAIIEERDELIRTLKSELKSCSGQTKAIMDQNNHCNEVIETNKQYIDQLQACLDQQKSAYAVLLASYKAACGDKVRQMFEHKCEQTEVDYLFEAVVASAQNDSSTTSSASNENDRLRNVIKALKKSLDEEVDKRKSASVDYDNLKSDIKKLAVKLDADGQLYIPTADADMQTGFALKDIMCQTYPPGETPPTSIKSDANAQTEQDEEDGGIVDDAENESDNSATPDDVGDPKTLWRANNRLQKEIKRLLKENIKLKEALSSAVNESNDMKDKLKTLLKGDPSSLAAELEKTLSSNAENRKIISDLLNEKEDLSQKMETELQPKIADLNNEITQLKEQIQQIRRQYAECDAERKKLLDEKNAFKPEPPGSTEDGDIVKENIRLQKKVHTLYQENLKLKFKTKAAKESGMIGGDSTLDECTAKERISTLEEMSEKIETSLSASFNEEDVAALKEQVLELQNALQDALETIRGYEQDPNRGVAAASAGAPVEATPVQISVPRPAGAIVNESKITQTEVPCGPTRVQLLVKIAIIGTKLTHRTNQIEQLEATLKEKERELGSQGDIVKEKDDKIAELEETIGVKEAELVENRAEISTFQEKMDEFEKALAAKQKEIEDLVFQAEEEASKTASAGASLEDLAHWKSKYADVKAQKKKLQASINFANKTLEEYKVNIDMLTSKVVQYDEDMNSFFSTITEALKNDPICCNKNFGYISEKDKLQSAKNIITKFIEFTGQSASKAEELTKENKTQKEQLAAVTEKFDDVKKKLTNTEGDLERTKNILETSQLELNQKVADYNNIKDNLDKLQLEHDGLTTELDALKKENDSNKQKLAEFQDRVKDLSTKLQNADQVIAEKDKDIGEKEKSIAEKIKDIEEIKSQLQSESQAHPKPEDELAEEDADNVQEGKKKDDGEKSIKSSIKMSLKDVPEKGVLAKLRSIEKEVNAINKDILKTSEAINELHTTAEDGEEDGQEKKQELLDNLNSILNRLTEKNEVLIALCSANGIKARPRKSKGEQTDCTILPGDEVEMPGAAYEPSERAKSIDTLSQVSEITNKSSPVGHVGNKIQELEEIIQMKDMEIKELTEKIDAFRKLTPSPASADAKDEDNSHDANYWKEKATRLEGYKKKCTVLEKDLKMSSDELNKLRKQLIKDKSQEASLRDDLDEQLNNLQRQLDEDKDRQLQIQENLKNCQEEQKQEQEQLNNTLLESINQKQKMIDDLLNKVKTQANKNKGSSKEKIDVKAEVDKSLSNLSQSYAELQGKYEQQLNERDDEILELKSNLRDLQKTKKNLTNEIDEKKMTIESLESKINLLEKDINDGSQTYRAYKQEVRELKDILDDKMKQIATLEEELHTVSSHVQRNKDTAELAINRMRESELARKEISERSLELQRKHDEEMKTKKQAYKDAGAKAKALEAQVESLKNILVKKHDVEEDQDDKEIDLDVDPEIVQTMNNDDLMEQIKSLTAKLADSEKKRIDMKVDFKATLCELEGINTLLEDKEKDRDQLARLVSNLRKEMESLRATESAQSNQSQQTATLPFSEEEYQEMQNELEFMVEELRAADEEKKQLQKQRKQEKAQFLKIKSELGKRIEEYACLLAVHNKLENAISNLEEQNMQSGLEIEAHKVEILGLKNAITKAGEDVERAEELSRSKNVEIENLKSEIINLTSDVKSLTSDNERVRHEHEAENAILSKSMKDLEEDRNNLLKKIESISTAAISQGSGRNSNVDHAKRFVNILKDLNQERVSTASASQRMEFTALQNEITDLKRKLELTDNKRSHLVHELKRCECELQEVRDDHEKKSEENRGFISHVTTLNGKIAKLERKFQDASAALKNERQCGDLLLEENRHLYADKEKAELSIEELNTNLKSLLEELELSNSKVATLSEKLEHCDQLVRNLQKVNKLKTGDNFELVELNAHLLEKLHVHEPVDVISEELDDLRQQIQPDRGLTEMMYEIEILQSEKSKLENEIKLMKAKEREGIKVAEKKQQLKIAELQNKLTIIQSNNEGTKEFIINLNAENNELKSQLQDLQNKLEKSEDSLRDQLKDIEKLKAQTEKSKTIEVIAATPDNEKDGLIESLKDEMSKIHEELNIVNNENRNLKNIITKNESEYHSAFEQSQQYEDLVNDLNNEIGRLESDLDQKVAEVKQCTVKINDSKKQIAVLTEETWSMGEKLGSMKESNNNKDEIIKGLKKKCEVLENKLAVLTLDHNSLLQEMDEVAGELDKAGLDDEKRKEMDETVKEVLDQNERLAKENERLQTELENKEAAYKTLKRSHSNDSVMKKQVKHLKDENENLHKELSEVQNSCNKLAHENSRLSEASTALQMINFKVKELKDNNDNLKKALKKELSRDEARYLVNSVIDRIIKKLNERIPDEIKRLHNLLSSKELDIQRLAVEIDTLHNELMETDKILISHNLQHSSPARVDNRELYDAAKQAAIANRKVKIYQNQLEDFKLTLNEVFDENKMLAGILKEAQNMQENLSTLPSPSSASIATASTDCDLKDQIRELQIQLQDKHEELVRAQSLLDVSKRSADGKLVCTRCRNIISTIYDSSLNESDLLDLVDEKDRTIVFTEQEIEDLKKSISDLERKMRNTHHGGGTSMVSLSRETYALKRKLRQCENRLKDLRKEREEVSAQLRAVEPQKYKTPTKFNKKDVIKELKWRLEGGSPPNDIKNLKRENEELREHIMEMTDYLCDQKWHQDIDSLRSENAELKNQLEELSNYLDNDVTPDNDVQRVVDSAMTTIQQDETVIKAIQDELRDAQEELATTQNFIKTLKKEMLKCWEDCEALNRFKSITNSPRDLLKKHNTRLKNIMRTLDSYKESTLFRGGDKDLKIYILRSGEVKVKCTGGTPGDVRVAQISGYPESEDEREQWCRDLEKAVDVIKGLKSPSRSQILPRTSSPKHPLNTTPTPAFGSMSTIAEDRVLLKLVLHLPSSLNCSIELE